VDNSGQLNSRWYSGSGIYRSVFLAVAEPVHVAQWGTWVTTPSVDSHAATVKVRTTVDNESDSAVEAVLKYRVLAPGAGEAAKGEAKCHVPAWSKAEATAELEVASPKLWSTGNPSLYTLETELLAGGKAVDADSTVFGIRTIEFSAEKGFLLNGVPTKIRGGCVHHDNGIMGAAAFERSEERKVETLKAAGHNGVRTAHNPPSTAFLDACDRHGMLVMDEAFDCWREGKNHHDYHCWFDDWWKRDVDSMVLRDRNHPSVIMWSVGNELCERALPEGHRIAGTIAHHIRSLDPTRAISGGINGDKDWRNLDGLFAHLDVGGYNYQYSQYLNDHKLFPNRVIVGTESAPKEAFDNWVLIDDNPHLIGDFVWTSLDYLGESGIGRVHYDGDKAPFLPDFPWHQANCGDLDLACFRRPQSYYRSILWHHGEKLYIAVNDPIPEGKIPTVSYWGWPEVWPNWNRAGSEGKSFAVDVYSACEEVELFLNDKSLGRKPSGKAERRTASFAVPYEAGTLKAVGYDGGKKVADTEVRTTGPSVRLKLSPEKSVIKADRGSLLFVTAEVLDQDGLLVPDASDNLVFTVKGEAELAAVGTGNPTTTEPYRGNQRRAHRGRVLVALRSTGKPGEIRLRASADGLDGAEAIVRAA
jgi:beta-galactosidase